MARKKHDGLLSPAEVARQEIEELRKQAYPENDVEDMDTDSDEGDSEQDNEESNDVDDSEGSSSTNEFTEQKQTPREETVEYWKHRFDVVQGQQRAEANQFRQEIASLQQQITSLQLAPTAPQGGSVSEILDNLEEEYGADFTRAIDQRIRNVVSSQVEASLANFKSEVKELKQTQTLTDQQLFEGSLTSVVPNWMTINTNPAFVSWLQNNVEPYSKVSYLTILQNAFNKRDIETTARFFNDFQGLTTKKTTNSNTPSSSQAAMVAPPKRGSSSNASVENNQGKVFTFAEVNAFYKDLQDGKYRGKEEQARLRKQEYLKANAEGRIV